MTSVLPSSAASSLNNNSNGCEVDALLAIARAAVVAVPNVVSAPVEIPSMSARHLHEFAVADALAVFPSLAEDSLLLDSVKRKRRKMMNKHKLRKRRRRDRHKK